MAWDDELNWPDWATGLWGNFDNENPYSNPRDDPILQELFELGWLDSNVDTDMRIHAREDLVDYMESHYGIDFDDYFDWDAWRDEMGYNE